MKENYYKNEDHHKSLSEVHKSVETAKHQKPWRRFLAFSGPAYMVAVGYMDPGNWATDIAGGSGFGYSLIWVLMMSNLMALLLQSLSARLGIVRGEDLAQASRNEYPRSINLFLYGLAEIAIAACDLAEVLGMAIGLNLLFHIPLIWAVAITVLDTFLLLFLLNFGIRKIEAFILSLVMVIGVSFLVQMILAKPDLGEISRGIIPGLKNNEALFIAIGIIGATVMPHNLYLHSSLVQTRKFGRKLADLRKAIKYNLIDSAIALNSALFVNAAILILAASTFFVNGLHEITEIQDAHKMLEPMLGNSLAPILFAVALIAAGQSSTVTGTMAGQIIMEGYLRLRIQPWVRRIITRLIAIVPAMLVIAFLGESATGKMLVLSQVILSLQLGFAIIPLIHFVSDRKKMGELAINLRTRILSWLTATIIIGLNVKMVSQQLSDWYQSPDYGSIILKILVIIIALISFIILLYITFLPLIRKSSIPENTGLHGGIKSLNLNDEKKYRRILVAVDFSRADENAISTALTLGGQEAVFRLIHVTESPGAIYFGNNIEDSETVSDAEQLDNYVKLITERKYTVDSSLGQGNRRKEIAREVQEFKADLLIMGAHGHRAVKDILFGSTVDAVRHDVKIPVLVVR